MLVVSLIIPYESAVIRISRPEYAEFRNHQQLCLISRVVLSAIIGIRLWSKSVRFVTTALLTGKSKSSDRDFISYSSLGSAATICSLLRGRGSAIVGHQQFFGSAITLSAGVYLWYIIFVLPSNRINRLPMTRHTFRGSMRSS